jgi:hypothetical protein
MQKEIRVGRIKFSVKALCPLCSEKITPSIVLSEYDEVRHQVGKIIEEVYNNRADGEYEMLIKSRNFKKFDNILRMLEFVGMKIALEKNEVEVDAKGNNVPVMRAKVCRNQSQ